MAKYSEKFKLMIVKEYQEGKLGYRRLAKKYGMNDTKLMRRWIKVYEQFGANGLMSKRHKETYSVQFKLNVIRFMERTGSSELETALQFGLTSPPLISSWKKAFLEGGAGALEKPKGRRQSMSDKAENRRKQPKEEKDVTHEQKLERENELLRLEVEYLKKLRAFQMDPEGYLEKHKQRYHSNSKKISD
ncbi:transposase [Virgibacillus sp. MSP4-1]|uniref:helix-turn-helix domain-containing protein n=1 Tax=Virgibacillus sp. MSP4-1 TaxID=2700081 RepID=UPI00137BB100|nr:helix-turn-helix domain-containing protein [Virgibacillus sp. MSP4-1]QHS23251.1 transposase [Virgibacillus sp. MSP4-1]QHS23589.1 transposase [Virgibacillus sp. MSP4-1]QHS23618.1 transposase [Virgibacillus sp. MSP4-1]QHS24146.1 transposase [Virgibacillus sp. MSP4-1]